MDPSDTFATFVGGSPSGVGTNVALVGTKVVVPYIMDTATCDQLWVGQIKGFPKILKLGLDFQMYSNPNNQPTESAFLSDVGTTDTIVGYIDHGFLSASDYTTALGICFTHTCLISKGMFPSNPPPGNGPSISLLSPLSGPVGSTVSIVGANFGAAQAGDTVTFNGVLATVVTWGPSQIVVTVPAGATSGDVVVTVNGTGSNGYLFAVANSSSISLSLDLQNSVTVKARVLFLAMCGFTDAFKSFWNMTSSPNALVYPVYLSSNPNRRLLMGFASWDFDEFLYGMANKFNVSYSVNLATQSAQYYNEQLTWGFIGDDFSFSQTP